MNKETAIIEHLQKIFADAFNLDVPRSDTDLVEEGVLDSFQFVELLVRLEQDFSFRIDIEEIDLDDLRTLDSIADLVGKHSAALNGAGAHGHASA